MTLPPPRPLSWPFHPNQAWVESPTVWPKTHEAVKSTRGDSRVARPLHLGRRFPHVVEETHCGQTPTVVLFSPRCRQIDPLCLRTHVGNRGRENPYGGNHYATYRFLPLRHIDKNKRCLSRCWLQVTTGLKVPTAPYAHQFTPTPAERPPTVNTGQPGLTPRSTIKVAHRGLQGV